MRPESARRFVRGPHARGEASQATNGQRPCERAINAVRVDQGNAPLRIAQPPKAYERIRGKELKQRFGHSPMGLRGLLAKNRLRLRHAAEVVAEDRNLGAICRGWMLSPSHRAALLDERRNRIAFVKRGDRLSAYCGVDRLKGWQRQTSRPYGRGAFPHYL